MGSSSLLLLTTTLLILPTTLIVNAKPSSTINLPIDFPIYKKISINKREINYLDNLEHRIKLHKSTLLKYSDNLEEVEEDDNTPIEPITNKKRAGSTGSSFLAGNDLSYYASISLGTPKKVYEVVLDTGSADLVIATTNSNQCGGSCTPTGPYYSVASSTTAKNSGQSVKLTYGTGSASGTVVSDTMSMAGYTATQSFAACNQINSLTSSSDQDGLMGLGWQSLSASNSTPFVQGLWQTGQLAAPVFGFAMAQLSAAAVPNPNAIVPGGILTIGGINNTLFSGTMNWIPLVSQSYWTIPLDNVGVGGNQLGISSANAVIDTGTNAIAVPASAAIAIYGSIPGSQSISGSGGLYAYPCATQVTFSLTFGGVVYSMLPEDFNTGYANRAGTQCVGAVASMGSANSAYQWIIGTPFLFSFYNAYRFSPPAVGFANIANPNNVLASFPIPTSGAVSVGSDSPIGSGAGSNAGTGDSISSPSPSLASSTIGGVLGSSMASTGISSTVTALAIGQSSSSSSNSNLLGTTIKTGSSITTTTTNTAGGSAASGTSAKNSGTVGKLVGGGFVGLMGLVVGGFLMI